LAIVRQIIQQSYMFLHQGSHCDRAEPSLTMLERLRNGNTLSKLLIKLEDKQGTGGRLNRPESAKNIGNLVGQKRTDNANIFSSSGLITCNCGFTTGKANQLKRNSSQLLLAFEVSKRLLLQQM